MERLCVIENLKAWNPNLQSRSAVRTSDTRHFIDPSIARAALELGPEDLLADLRTFGLMFESLRVRDLRVYAEALKGEVRHYRDASGLEADAAIHLCGGKWAANLRALAKRVEGRKPEFLMVVTATGVTCSRGDGVLVMPLGCLEV